VNYSSGFCFLGLTPLFSGPVASIDKQYRHGRRCTWRPSSATLLRWIFTYFSLLPSLSAHRLVYFPQLSTLTTSSGGTKITIKTNGRIINASGRIVLELKVFNFDTPTPSSGRFLFSPDLVLFFGFFTLPVEMKRNLLVKSAKHAQLNFGQIKSLLL
jgi:hypothetical protein